MAFWGVEVKPGKPYTHSYDEARGRLRVSQATLGNPVGAKAAKPVTEKTTVQCNVGEKSPVLICSLFVDRCETCHLELEFEEQEEVVFSVLGQRSVHLSGYYVGPRDGNEEPYGEDIAETESEDSDYNEYSEEEYESDFIDDDDDVEMYKDVGDMYTASRPHKSGVVIEEIIEEEKTANGDKSRLAKKKNRQVSDSDDAVDESQRQLAVVPPSSEQGDSEDEDGFPISDSKKTEEGKEENKKRKLDGSAPMDDEKMGEDNEVAKKKKKLDKKSKKKEKGEKGSLSGVSAEDGVEAKAPNDGSEKPKKETKEEPTKGDAVQEETPVSKKMIDIENGQPGDTSEKVSKKKKKKKNKKSAEKDQGKTEEKEEKDEKKEPQQSRTFGNGLVVEEISMGRPDGKKATPGSKVFVNYIGKLQNGKIFDSNVGQRPFKFRLGVGQVIKGWDVGISGMRVGDKRRLTIPPAMGYGDKAAGKIPKNSWLIFDVELLNVQ